MLNFYIINKLKVLQNSTQDLKTVEYTSKEKESRKQLEIETPRKKSGVMDANINNGIKEIEERITGAEDTILSIDSTVKNNSK